MGKYSLRNMIVLYYVGACYLNALHYMIRTALLLNIILIKVG